MFRFLIAAAATVAALPLVAQTPAAPPLLATSGAEIQAQIARAAAAIKPGEPVLTRPVLLFDSYTALLEYRQAATNAAIHQDEAEVFWVLQGGGRLIQGGTLVGAKPVDAHNQSGTAIAGGSGRHVAAGDVFVVPAGTPHWFDAVDGKLVMISLKVPRRAPAP